MRKNKQIEEKYNIMIIGDENIGKTSFLER